MKYLGTSNDCLINWLSTQPKKSDKILMKLLGLQFKLDNMMKSKAMKYMRKIYILILSKVVLIFYW